MPRSAPDLTRGPLVWGLLFLAIPTWGAHFLETAYNIVNGIFVGRVGTESLAAVNASAFFMWLAWSQLNTVSTGTASVVANCVGAGQRDRAERAVSQGVLLGLCLGLLMLAIGLLVRGSVLRAMGLEPAVVALGVRYLGILFTVVPLMAFAAVLGAAMRGYGDARTPTLVDAIVLLMNICLAPILVLGLWGAPRLGVAGAAIATVTSATCGCLILGTLLAVGRLPFHLHRRHAFSTEFMPDILRIGFPTSFSSVIFCLVYMGLTRVIAEFGTQAVAAVGIGHRVESLSFMTCLAFSIAAITMVGQNKGAGELQRAERSAWLAVGLATVVTAVMTVVMVSFPQVLARVFIDDPAVVPVAAGYVRIVGMAQIFMALDVVLEGAFSGAGDTVPPMAISIPLTLARIPLSWLVAVHWHVGIMGVWWVISGLMVLRGFAMAAWFARGRWKTRQVLRASEALPFGDEEALAAARAG